MRYSKALLRDHGAVSDVDMGKKRGSMAIMLAITSLSMWNGFVANAIDGIT